MKLGRTSNPFLTEETFRKISGQGSNYNAGAAAVKQPSQGYEEQARPVRLPSSDTMTIQGTVNKTFILLLIVLVAAYLPWNAFFKYAEYDIGMAASKIKPWMIGGAIGGFIAALVTIFKKNIANITAPLYAFFEGIFLGALSAFMESVYPGIVFQAFSLTIMTLMALLFAYKSRLIKATENFKLGVAAATGGIALVYLLTIILGFFGINMPFIHESGVIGIGFSVFVIVIAALNLVLDFDFIESGAEMGAPKYMEWYAAFGLMVTLIWLYVEFLRLLAKLRDN